MSASSKRQRLYSPGTPRNAPDGSRTRDLRLESPETFSCFSAIQRQMGLPKRTKGRLKGRRTLFGVVNGHLFLFALGQEDIELITGALQLTREDVGVAGEGDRCGVIATSRDPVTHQDGGDFRADAGVIEPGGGCMA